VGAVVTFTTPSASVVFTAPVAPALLPIPEISFPKVEKPKPQTPEEKALAKCKKKKNHKRRVACERAVRKRYAGGKSARRPKAKN
jgi:hypothetical protein